MQNLSRWRCEPPSTVPMAINASTLLLEAQGLRCRAPGKCTSCGMHMAQPNALILDDVSLAVAAGERIGLTGVSGSGKSTLLRALLALQPLDTGSLKVAGWPVEPGPVRSLRWFRRTVQYVPQSPAATLDPRRTVEQSLLEPMIALGCSGGASARISALLDDVELPSSLLKRTAGTLSGGQAQRVVIARALALSPRLLLADEPTSGLDLATRDVLMTLLERLMKTHGMALMMVTHDIGAMARLCMRGIVMSRGRIVEDSPMMALLKQPQHEETRALMHCAHVTGMAPLHRHVPQPMSSS